MDREPVSDPWSQWSAAAPAPIRPVPAGGEPELRGRRAIVGLPGLGWRGDLRCDDRVVQGSRTYVPVMPEHEWYRAESDQIEVFAPLVPVERVWVETIGTSRPDDAPARSDVVSRLVSLDEPPARTATPVVDVIGLTGRRVVQVVDGVERRDLRAVTELYSSAGGDICLRVARELDWYRWSWSGQSPRTLEVPVHLLWVE